MKKTVVFLKLSSFLMGCSGEQHQQPNFILKKLFLIIMATVLLQACGNEELIRTRPGLVEQMPNAADLNFLIVSFDALRADAMGIYGYDRDTSPNLDQFARESLLFDTAYTASPTTPTSFAAAFTGQYPYRVFIGWNLIPSVTLAGLLQENGFYTFGLFNNIQLAEERHFNQGFEKYAVVTSPDEKVLAEAKQLLNEAAGQRFFGWIHFISPHSPYEYREMSSQLAGLEDEGRYAMTTGGDFDVANEQELTRVRNLYDGEIYFGDDLFRQLMEHVESLGLMDNTVIIVTSDHGEEFMEHGQLQHNAVYEELVRIPLMIRHPGLKESARTDVPYVNVDLLPTIAAMAGIEPPGNIDGIDLFHAFDADRFRLSASMTNNKRYEIANEQSADKLILGCTPEFREELYDLEMDPGEKNDLILDKPQLAGMLSDAMKDITKSDPCKIMMNANRGRLPEELLSPEQIEQLRSLGYIQ
jgi:arylsulfatase A-like enzyme